nr:MAG TPA: hypothetical protein [Caudoviricetes sp.]
MYKRNMQIQIEKKDKIIVLLIVLMFLEAIVCYTGFVYYESQFDYVETYDTTKDVDIDTKGDNANAIKADGDATRALMTQNEIQSLRDQLQTANFQLSQQAQNATLIATLRPTPIPAYQTCSPYESAQMFSHYGTACNNGCGC